MFEAKQALPLAPSKCTELAIVLRVIEYRSKVPRQHWWLSWPAIHAASALPAPSRPHAATCHSRVQRVGATDDVVHMVIPTWWLEASTASALESFPAAVTHRLGVWTDAADGAARAGPAPGAVASVMLPDIPRAEATSRERPSGRSGRQSAALPPLRQLSLG